MRIFSNSKSNRATRAALAVCVACSVALPLVATAAKPANAQTQLRFSIGFNYFGDRLASYGRWVDHPRWGEVWIPRAANFRPYYSGRWEYTTDYGWFWVGNEPWADVVYHYGRWAFDPAYGWVWAPGYVWGPSWVMWREVDSYLGWFPMPPDYYEVYAGYGPRFVSTFGVNDWYGYHNWYGPSFSQSFFNLWAFVNIGDFGRTDPYRYVTDGNRVRDFYTRGQDRTRYEMRGDHIVSNSISVERVQRATENRFRPREARELIRDRAIVTTVSEGTEITRRNRDDRARERAARIEKRRAPDNEAVRERASRPEVKVQPARERVLPNRPQLERKPPNAERVREPARETERTARRAGSEAPVIQRPDRVERVREPRPNAAVETQPARVERTARVERREATPARERAERAENNRAEPNREARPEL